MRETIEERLADLERKRPGEAAQIRRAYATTLGKLDRPDEETFAIGSSFTTWYVYRRHLLEEIEFRLGEDGER